MGERKRSQAGWAGCKKALADCPRAGVLGLLREVYDLSPENRIFLQSRLLPAGAGGAATAAAERKVRALLSKTAIYNGRFRHGDVKRVVDQFAKGTGDPSLVASLLVSDLDAGCAIFDEVGDGPELADHLLAVINRLHKLLATVPLRRVPPLAERLVALAEKYGTSFGYGVSDELAALADAWAKRRPGDDGTADDADGGEVPSRPEPEW